MKTNTKRMLCLHVLYSISILRTYKIYQICVQENPFQIKYVMGFVEHRFAARQIQHMQATCCLNITGKLHIL